MGLFDDPNSAALAQLGFGLLQAGGPSRMPVSLGQAIGSAGQGAMDAYRQANKDKQAKEMQDLHMESLRETLNQARQMHPLQLQQLQAAISQANLQKELAAKFPQMIEAFRAAQAPKPYQDQLTPEMLGAKALPSVDFKGDPQNYFKLTMGIQDPTERRAALEAGFRQWPEMRPNMNDGATSQDAATAMGAFGAQVAMSGMKGGDEILKFAGMLTPRERKEGNTYENPLNGQREYMPKMDVGMRPNGRGGVEAVPGTMDFLRQKTIATVDPVAAGRLRFETGQDVTGSAGGAGGKMPGLPPKGAAEVKQKQFEIANTDWMDKPYRPTLDASKSADGMLANIQALRSIDVKTGWGTEAKAAAANALTGLGIAPKNAEMFAANAQKFQGIAMTRLWEVLNAAKGMQTEGDADRAKATFASLKNTNEADQFILDLAEAAARRDKLKGGFYSEAMPVAREDGDFTAVDRKWNQIQRSVWDDPVMDKWKKK